MAETTIAQHIEILRNSFGQNITKSYQFRIHQLRLLKQAIEKLHPEILTAIKADLGRSEFQAKSFEIDISLGYLDYTIQHLKQWMKPIEKDIPVYLGPGRNYLQAEPFGTVLIMGSWNFPIAISLNKLITAIAAGNTVLLKPSEMAQESAIVIEKIMGNLNPNCYRCIQGGPEVAIALTQAKWDLIAFTGSSEKGRLVAEAAAKNLTPTILELGGKNPVIVDSQADLDVAAMRILQGRFINSGQVCISPEMCLVLNTVVDEFLAKLLQYKDSYFGENPKTSPDYSRMINRRSTERIQQLLENHGGKLICGGQVDVENCYVAPTIILNPSLDAQIMKEEIFGPILLVLPVDDIDEAIEFINEREKPLALYYYGNNKSNFNRIKQETSSGNVSMYESVFHYAIADLSFGGVGNSGMGSYFGEEGFRSFSHMKSVLEKSSLNFYPLNVRYPPHTAHKQRMFNLLKSLLSFNFSTLNKWIIRIIALVVLAIVVKKKWYMKVLMWVMQKYFSLMGSG